MKVILFIQSLFVPSQMVKRKNTNIFVSILILLLVSTLLAVPMILYFNDAKYELLDENDNLKIFNYIVDENDALAPFTEDEKALYNLVSFEEFKALGIKANKNGLAYQESLVNGKEYVLKSYVPIKSDDGTITKYDTYYIHVVVDDYDANNDETATYDIEATFCKYQREEDGTFHHFFVGFYSDGMIVLNQDDASKATSLSYTKNTSINFDDATDMSYCSHAICDLLVGIYIYKASQRTFLYACLFPIILAFAISLIIKNKNAALVKTRQYIAIAAISSITPIIACTIASLVNMTWCSWCFNYYPFLFTGYYLLVLIIIGRRSRLAPPEDEAPTATRK